MPCGNDILRKRTAHVMPLAQINNVFELMRRGEFIRSMVTF